MMPQHPFAALAALLLLTAIHPLPARSQRVPSPYRFVDTGQEAELAIGFVSPGRGRFGYGPGPGSSFGARYGLHLEENRFIRRGLKVLYVNIEALKH